jgi:ATP synthase protein I
MVKEGRAPMSLLDPEAKQQLRTAGTVGAIGIEMALATVVGYFGGRWLDGQFGTAPWLMWIGLAFGIVAGFRGLYRIVKKTKDKM